MIIVVGDLTITMLRLMITYLYIIDIIKHVCAI